MASCPRCIIPSDFAHAEQAARVQVSRVRTRVPNELATTLSPSKSSYLAFVLTILGSVDLMDLSSEDARNTLSSMGTSDGAVPHLYLSTALWAFADDILNFTLARSLATLAILTADSEAAESDDCEMSFVTAKPHAPSMNALTPQPLDSCAVTVLVFPSITTMFVPCDDSSLRSANSAPNLMAWSMVLDARSSKQMPPGLETVSLTP